MNLVTAVRLGAGGFAAGVVGGMFGNGGGVIAVFLLSSTAVGVFKDRRLVYANVPVIMLPIALTSALIYRSHSHPDLGTVVAVGVSAFLGGLAGAGLLGKLDPRVISLIFGAVMIVSGLIMALV